jgi:hypothetical protein
LIEYRNENQQDLFATVSLIAEIATPALLQAQPLIAGLLLRVIRSKRSESVNAGSGDEQDHG